ncbi:quinol:cytochrome C oxidoreductase [Candidatus Marinamargulisbacteria bacterium SCGC AG-439-L15]|nr:quinol:cytochrome C oxidoreductase [Candidatus Marinamargulisbacteria bacterium SCGC AG-439-L15]
MKRNYINCIILLTICIFLSGCRGWRSEKPPLHPNPNLDFQSKFKAQRLSNQVPENTVIWGNEQSFSNETTREQYLKKDRAFYTGRKNGRYLNTIPTPVTKDFIQRGQNRYNIYCASCHTQTGDGTKSLISKRGWVIPNINQKITQKKSDGELFNIISNGIRTMPGYHKSITEKDRWAIVAYVRALQKVENTNYQDLPAPLAKKLK